MTSENRKLIAPCGVYCGNCPLYRARQDESLRKKMAERQGIPLEKVAVCAGCRALQGNVKVAGGSPTCGTYACSVEHGVEFCGDCSDFPCARLEPCADRAGEIPHNLKVFNLVCLKKEGVETWLEKYPERLRHYFQGKKTKPGSESQL